MKANDFSDLDLNIARARVVLSLVALVSLYVDPAVGRAFYLSRFALAILSCHLGYSLTVLFLVSRRNAPSQLPTIAAGLDIVFAAAVVLVSEPAGSAPYIFFVFAIVAVDRRTGFRDALSVTFCSGLIYFVLLVFTTGSAKLHYAMHAAYLIVTGYLIGFIGQQRAKFEARIRELETSQERHRIARSLHDGYVQALAGMALRLESCRKLIGQNQTRDALSHLTELQSGVAREFDEVRAYVRSLANLDQTLSRGISADPGTRFRIETAFTAGGLLVEQIIQIMLEAMRNALHHGNARTALINASEDRGVIRIKIDDDGIGFAQPGKAPWAIASRVAEVGGQVRIVDSGSPGAHIEIEMPTG